MTILLYIYLFLLGAVLGSFYNVVALRIPAGESLISPPSRCPNCGKRLGGRDLIPIASWLLSRGRCRHCSMKVSPLYPIGEAANGLLFVWSYFRFGWEGHFVTALLLVSLAVIISIADFKYMLIPNKVLLFFTPFLGLSVLIWPTYPIWSHLIGIIVGGGVLLLIRVVSKGGMGMGDVKLFALLGFLLGAPLTFVALLIACLGGTIIGGILLVTGTVKRKQPMPFGPYLALGALVAYGYGQNVIDWYFSLFT